MFSFIPFISNRFITVPFSLPLHIVGFSLCNVGHKVSCTSCRLSLSKLCTYTSLTSIFPFPLLPLSYISIRKCARPPLFPKVSPQTVLSAETSKESKWVLITCEAMPWRLCTGNPTQTRTVCMPCHNTWLLCLAANFQKKHKEKWKKKGRNEGREGNLKCCFCGLLNVLRVKTPSRAVWSNMSSPYPNVVRSVRFSSAGKPFFWTTFAVSLW